YGLLASGFATLAVPLAFSARVTAVVFVLEGAAFVWLGLKQEHAATRWKGGLLHALGVIAFVFSLGSVEPLGPPLTGPIFLSALVIAFTAFVCAWWFLRAGLSGSASLYYWWGLTVWIVNGVAEIHGSF